MAKRKKPNEEEPSDSSENFNESDDTFGLPEIEYEPIKREEEEPEAEAEEEGTTSSEEAPPYEVEAESEPEQEQVVAEPVEDSSPFVEDLPRYDEAPPSQYNYTYSHETESPVWPRALLIVLAVVVLVGGGLWYFLYYKPMRDEERRIAAAQLAASDAAYRKEKNHQDSLTQIENARMKRIADSIASIPPKPAVGSIDTLKGRTGLYYVVVASDIDDDLLMDYARNLSGKGVSSKMIPPHGKVKFYRLTIAEGDTYANAQTTADGLKAEYGNNLWVTKY
jgi:hypothetical protein